MSDENTTEPVNYAAMYDQGQAPAESVDIVEETIDEVLEEETRPSVVEEPVIEEVPVVEEPVIEVPTIEEVPEVARPGVVEIDQAFKLRVRETADKDGKVLEMLDAGTKLLVYSSNGDWLEVEVPSSGTNGFVNKTYVKMEDE